MRISQLYTYPIKSLRGTPAASATITRFGFQYDRRFMLLKVQDDGSLKNMHVVYFPEMTLFNTAITYPTEHGAEDGSVTVTFNAPGRDPVSLDIPLQPETGRLNVLDITMHKSPTKAFDMGPSFSDWFSECFGYSVVLAYLGENRRVVLMSRSLNVQSNASSWLSSITSSIPLLGGGSEKDEITFADCAPFLVASETSLKNVSARLPDGEEMDITKFRPNVIIEGAEEPWEEDFWAEIAVGDAKITLTHNCVRCASINIDYSTGKPGTGESGQVLKKLQKDRRVDTGAKYSPVFGRYGFPDTKDAGKSIAIGDEVKVVRRNAERTRFDWPGLGN